MRFWVNNPAALQRILLDAPLLAAGYLTMMAVTFTAIVLKIKELVISLYGEFDSGNAIQLVFAILLLILGVMVAVEGLQKLFGERE